MRWIQRGAGKLHRGNGTPPDGDCHFVSEQGSMAMVGGRLYIDGQPAHEGEHEIALPDLQLDQAFIVEVGQQGRVARKAVRKKGGKPNG